MWTSILTVGLALAIQAGPEANFMARKEARERYQAGERFLRNELFEKAADEFKAAIVLDPLLLAAHYNLGQSYMALKRYAEAAAAYEACRDTVEQLGHVGQKELEERDRENEREIQELRNALVQLQTEEAAVNPKRPRSVEGLKLQAEQRIRVLEDSRLKGREAPRVPAEVNLGLGSAYFRQNQLEPAEQAYRKAIESNSKLGAAHNNLAVIYMLTGRFKESHEAVRAAEKAGFTVAPGFKADLEAREKAASKSAP